MNALHSTEINQNSSGHWWCNEGLCEKRFNGFRGLQMRVEKVHGKDI